MRRCGGMALAAAVLIAASAHAAQTPQAGAGDPRMRVVFYEPEQVVEVVGDLGYQFSIEFGADERIENVSIGNAQGWQITPNRKASLLFLKPVDRAPATNMTIVTNLRRYAFELSVRRGRPATRDAVVYGLRFDYPPPPPVLQQAAPPPPRPPEVVNAAYSYDGSSRNLPLRIFDDGKATYFQFAEADDYPAIYAIGADKAESVVNFAVRDGYIVVDRVERGFVLRRGTEQTRLYNDGFRETLLGPLSPKLHAKPKRFPW